QAVVIVDLDRRPRRTIVVRAGEINIRLLRERTGEDHARCVLQWCLAVEVGDVNIGAVAYRTEVGSVQDGPASTGVAVRLTALGGVQVRPPSKERTSSSGVEPSDPNRV